MVARSSVGLVLVVAASLLAGCASKPARTPRILGSYAPPGAGQPPPLQSVQPIQVPAAPVGLGGAVLQAVPAVPAATLAVPVQPGSAVPPQANGGGVPRAGERQAPGGQTPSAGAPATGTQERQYTAPTESGSLDPLPAAAPNR